MAAPRGLGRSAEGRRRRGAEARPAPTLRLSSGYSTTREAISPTAPDSASTASQLMRGFLRVQRAARRARQAGWRVQEGEVPGGGALAAPPPPPAPATPPPHLRAARRLLRLRGCRCCDSTSAAPAAAAPAARVSRLGPAAPLGRRAAGACPSTMGVVMCMVRACWPGVEARRPAWVCTGGGWRGCRELWCAQDDGIAITGPRRWSLRGHQAPCVAAAASMAAECSRVVECAPSAPATPLSMHAVSSRVSGQAAAAALAGPAPAPVTAAALLVLPPRHGCTLAPRAASHRLASCM